MLTTRLLPAMLPAFLALLPVVVAAQGRDLMEPLRHRMVAEYIEAEGVTDLRVLESMRNTPRHEFVRIGDPRRAYHDAALPIGHGQTISPPFVVAYMTESIDPQPSDKVLEIGTGSGYQAAVLSPLVKEVYTIEIVEELARSAKETLGRLKYTNVHPKTGDGYQGWPEHAPFDKIIVTCSPEKVPAPLVEQLAEGGKLIVPLGERYQQVFYLFEKRDGRLSAVKLIPTLFVPMTGISEERRSVRPDPLRPQIINGGFEDDSNNDGMPDGWHYRRQSTLQEGSAPGGDRWLSIENTEPGRLAQALQGFAVDGRGVAALNVTVSLRKNQIRNGPNRGESPGLVVLFYDQRRKTIGSAHIAPPLDDEIWTERTRLIPIPAATREAILAVTLGGGTGRLDVDEVSIAPITR